MSYGRRRIFTDETEISKENVIAEVEAAFLVHSDNRTEVEKLYQYYRIVLILLRSETSRMSQQLYKLLLQVTLELPLGK